ncbi:Malate:quinone oxidoreductase [Pantoea agglomerans]|uniref:malate dehydrogenase (quinone) n=1 Tax=Enterobacter agglomerans TaxID=549 RepID=A0A379LR13_ENTAG|nr:Malate:quinone oxidoreductase [Pantoea agglomerans]
MVVALESSNGWNNAGTGHSANMELNYTPERKDGSIDVTKALEINEAFMVSRQFWSSQVKEGVMHDPRSFINSTPHMSFVWGDNVDFLTKTLCGVTENRAVPGHEVLYRSQADRAVGTAGDGRS